MSVIVARVPRDPSRGVVAYRVQCACGWSTLVLPLVDGVLFVKEEAGRAEFAGPLRCARCGIVNEIPPVDLENARHVRLSCCGG